MDCEKEWVLNKASVDRTLLNSVKSRKLIYYGHIMRKQGNCLEKEIIQGTLPGARKKGRPHTTWLDNIKAWSGVTLQHMLRTAEDRSEWRILVHCAVNIRSEDDWRRRRRRRRRYKMGNGHKIMEFRTPGPGTSLAPSLLKRLRSNKS